MSKICHLKGDVMHSRKRKSDKITEQSLITIQESLHNKLWGSALDNLDVAVQTKHQLNRINLLTSTLQKFKSALEVMYFNGQRSDTLEEVHLKSIEENLTKLKESLSQNRFATKNLILPILLRLNAVINLLKNVNNKTTLEESLILLFEHHKLNYVELYKSVKNARHQVNPRLLRNDDDIKLIPLWKIIDELILVNDSSLDNVSQVEFCMRALSLMSLDLCSKSKEDINGHYVERFCDGSTFILNLLAGIQIPLGYRFRCLKSLSRYYKIMSKHLDNIDPKNTINRHLNENRVILEVGLYVKFKNDYNKATVEKRTAQAIPSPRDLTDIDQEYVKACLNGKWVTSSYSAKVKFIKVNDRIIRKVSENYADVPDKLKYAMSLMPEESNRKAFNKCAVVKTRKVRLCYKPTVKRILAAANIDDDHIKIPEIYDIQRLAFIEFKYARLVKTKIRELYIPQELLQQSIPLICNVEKLNEVNAILSKSIKLSLAAYKNELKNSKSAEATRIQILSFMIKAIEFYSAVTRNISETQQRFFKPQKIDVKRMESAEAQYYVAAKIIDCCLREEVDKIVTRTLNDGFHYQDLLLSHQLKNASQKGVRSRVY